MNKLGILAVLGAVALVAAFAVHPDLLAFAHHSRGAFGHRWQSYAHRVRRRGGDLR